MGIMYAVIEYRYKKEENEIKIPSDLSLDDFGKIQEDKIGEIPFTENYNKNFDNEMNTLKEEKPEETKDTNIQEENETENTKRKSKTKKGKHF
jgi:hypothetical protein